MSSVVNKTLPVPCGSTIMSLFSIDIILLLLTSRSAPNSGVRSSTMLDSVPEGPVIVNVSPDTAVDIPPAPAILNVSPSLR